MPKVVKRKSTKTGFNSLLNADQDYSIWWLILSMRRAMYKARAKELSEFGLTPEETAVLHVVHSIGSRTTPPKISQWLLREPHSIFDLLRRMERKGLLKLTKDLERKNLVRVSTTKKGKRLYQQSTKRESIHRIMSVISDEECQQLEECLHKLRDSALNELGVIAKPPFP